MATPITPADSAVLTNSEPTAVLERTDPATDYRITETGDTRITEDEEAIELE